MGDRLQWERNKERQRDKGLWEGVVWEREGIIKRMSGVREREGGYS